MSGFSSAEELIFRQQAQQLGVRLDDIEITNRLETYIHEVKKLKNEREVQGPIVTQKLTDKTDLERDLNIDPNDSPDNWPEVYKDAVKEYNEENEKLDEITGKLRSYQSRVKQLYNLKAYLALRDLKKKNSIKEPKMGGIIDTLNSREIYTGGKPLVDWSGLESKDLTRVQPTQIRAKTAKGASSMNERLRGMYGDTHSSKFKHHQDLDFFCRKLEEFFVRHGLDTIAYRRNPSNQQEMLSVITNYPRFSMDSVKIQNTAYEKRYDEYDKQNDSEAITCLLNSLDEELHQDIWTRIEPTMLFSEVFMIFVQHERPQNGETYDSLEQKLINFDVSLTNYAGSNIKDICGDMRKIIKALVRANQYDSKHNSRLCRTLIQAGGLNNEEFTLPLHIKLKDIKQAVTTSSHLPCAHKLKYMSQKGVGFEDIFRLAEDLYAGMTTEGNIRWPPMCNPYDGKTPPDNFGANLMQINRGKKHNGGHNGGNNGGHYKHKKNGNGKHRTNHRKNGNHKAQKDAWKFQPPPKDMKPIEFKSGYPVFKKVVKGKEWWWCAKCSSNGKWTTSHSTKDHDPNFQNRNKKKQSIGQANVGEGLVPDRSLWLAEINTSALVLTNDASNRRIPRRHVNHRKGRNVSSKRARKNMRRSHWSKAKTDWGVQSTPRLNVVEPYPTPRSIAVTSDKRDLKHLMFGLFLGGLIAMTGKWCSNDWNQMKTAGIELLKGTWTSALSVDWMNVFWKAIEWTSILSAPILWIVLGIGAVYGRNMLYQWYPDVSREAFEMEKREIRRYYHDRIYKERNKFFSNLAKERRRNNRQMLQARRLDTLLRDKHIHPYHYDISTVLERMNGERSLVSIPRSRHKSNASRVKAWKPFKTRKKRNARVEAVQSVSASRFLQRKEIGMNRDRNGTPNRAELPVRKNFPKSEISNNPKHSSPTEKRLHRFYQRKLLDSIDFHIKHILYNYKLVERVDNKDDPTRLKYERIPKSMLSFDTETDENDPGSRPYDVFCGSHQPVEEQISAIRDICNLQFTPSTHCDKSRASRHDDITLHALQAVKQHDWKRVLMQSPGCCNLALADSFEIIWDSGASMCISNDKNDFIGDIKSLTNLKVDGISSQLKLEGIGEVRWTLFDILGNSRDLILPAYYAPSARQRLLSTTAFCDKYPKNQITVSPNMWTINPDPRNPDEHAIDVLINRNNNLPMSTCHHKPSLDNLAVNFASSTTTTHTNNYNLAEPQKELLRWHYRLGHVGMQTVKWILRTGALATTKAMKRLHTRAANVPHHDTPKCAACQFGKQTRRSTPGRVSSAIKDREGVLSAEALQPGQRVFVDHFVCSTRGRKWSGQGIQNTKRKASAIKHAKSYAGGCIFVDAASGYIDIQFQSFFTSNETISAVQRFEEKARDNGIIVSEYHSDSGSAFTSKEFRQHLANNGQTNRFSAPGSHHQNGRAERGIRTIMGMARTMMLHAAVHWPDMADATLWPMSVNQAVWIYNRMPNLQSGTTPNDLWSRTRSPLRQLHDLHVFGCPIYVLSKSIADGKKIPRWQPRSNRGVYMGRSPDHAGNVPLVLNTRTGNITPQWNVVFDDWFSTIAADGSDLPDFNADEWSKMFGTSTYCIPCDEDYFEEFDSGIPNYKRRKNNEDIEEEVIPQDMQAEDALLKPTQVFSEKNVEASTPSILKHKSSSQPEPHSAKTDRNNTHLETVDVVRHKAMDRNQTKPFDENTTTSPLPNISTRVTKVSTPQQRWARPSTLPPHNLKRKQERSTAQIEEVSKSSPKKKVSFETDTDVTESTGLRRSTRVRKEPDRLGVWSNANLAMSSEEQVVDDLTINHIAQQCGVYFAAYGIDCEVDVELSKDTIECLQKLDEMSPHQFAQVFQAAKKKNPDILSYDEAMADQANLQAWLKAALKEIRQLESQGVWTECRKSEAKGQQIVPCTWVFRYKRNPAGEIIKCKARICMRGDLMIDDAESYAPVVQWSSIRLFLVLAMHMAWTTISVDWICAFPQTPLEKPMFVQTPRGFFNKYGKDGCLKLAKSLYGSKFAPRLWYQYLRKALLKLGLRECPHDKCLFYRPGLLMILYVDDAGIAAPSRNNVEEFVEELRAEGFELEIEGDFTEYLGIGIEEMPDGTRHMTQKGLIEKIVATTKMTDCKPNWTPTTHVALGTDPDGELWDNKQWNYASVVGMLLYVSNNTRPDITFAVSQVARFTAAPKVSHARAVKSIVRYLARTAALGIMVKPDGTYDLVCWVDTDFSGLFKRELESDPNSAKSRYGYIITFGGVPLIWKSQLISEICLSTLHAEYVGLANALRALIPLRSLVLDTLGQLKLPSAKVQIETKVLEDNQGAYLLATNQQISQRTKYFNVKYHFFWQHVYHKEKNPEGWLHIEKCDTELMNADYLTKGLVRVKFEGNRFRTQGW